MYFLLLEEFMVVTFDFFRKDLQVGSEPRQGFIQDSSLSFSSTGIATPVGSSEHWETLLLSTLLRVTSRCMHSPSVLGAYKGQKMVLDLLKVE